MQGSSRNAELEGRPVLESALTSGQPAVVADDLFGVTGLLDEQATLRRTLIDPTREAADKDGLVTRLLGEKISEQALRVVCALVGQRWSRERDLTDTLERFAVEAVLKGAGDEGGLDRVEEELFRFERVVTGAPELRDAIGNRHGNRQGKAELVSRLLQDKARPESVRLARQAVLAPRGRRFDRTIEEYLDIAAERRDQLTAVVTTAVDLSDEQQDRLTGALRSIYDKPVLLQVIRDEHVIGGMRIEIDDEVVDGTVLRRLDEAKRHLAG